MYAEVCERERDFTLQTDCACVYPFVLRFLRNCIISGSRRESQIASKPKLLCTIGHIIKLCMYDDILMLEMKKQTNVILRACISFQIINCGLKNFSY